MTFGLSFPILSTQFVISLLPLHTQTIWYQTPFLKGTMDSKSVVHDEDDLRQYEEEMRQSGLNPSGQFIEINLDDKNPDFIGLYTYKLGEPPIKLFKGKCSMCDVKNLTVMDFGLSVRMCMDCVEKMKKRKEKYNIH